MEISDIPLELTDKIFQIKFNPDQSIEKITSYFPLSEQERLMINSISDQDAFSNFNSIFSDTVTDEEWNKIKEQIKKRFQNELFDIDDET
jgi:L-asparaginase/Glu-tRNA(Gln) amidotransferase subunit D